MLRLSAEKPFVQLTLHSLQGFFFFGRKFSEPNGLIIIYMYYLFGQGGLSKVPPLDSTGDV